MEQEVEVVKTLSLITADNLTVLFGIILATLVIIVTFLFMQETSEIGE